MLQFAVVNAALFGLVLALTTCVCELAPAPVTQPCTTAVTALTQDHGSLLRGLWLQHMRDRLRGIAPPQPVRVYSRQKLLYCRVGIGFHLQIVQNGSVGGAHTPTEDSVMKVFAMQQGVVGIQGVKSGLYLCMDEEGITRGVEHFSDSRCLFKETLEANHYTTYSALSHPSYYLALSSKGELKRGNAVSRNQACTHFLPRDDEL